MSISATASTSRRSRSAGWLSALGLDRRNLRGHQINPLPSSSQRSRGHKLPYGVATLKVHDTRVVQHVFGAIQEYGGFDEPAWLDGRRSGPSLPSRAMSDLKQQISPEGKAAAEAELKELTEVRRPEIVEAIKVAREFGDLKENAEYHAAREQQGMNEARIRQLEHQLAHAQVVKATTGGTAGVGSTVSWREGATGKVSEMTLVHPLEASMPDNKLSVESPVGRALLGASKGDEVEISTPRGSKQLEILDVG